MRESILAQLSLIVDGHGNVAVEKKFIDKELFQKYLDEFCLDFQRNKELMECVDFIQMAMAELELKMMIRYGSESVMVEDEDTDETLDIPERLLRSSHERRNSKTV